MILVLNLNASVDKRYALKDFAKGKVVRATSVQNTAGGKGLHVANVAHALGADVVTSGFVGGKAGEFIEECMAAKGLKGDFTHVAGETRSCLAILTDDGAQTEILEPGPTVTAEELADFRKRYTRLLADADVVVASGSVPRGVPKAIYRELIEEAHAHGIPFLLDTSGEALEKALPAKPDFIKPNKDEIEALTGRTVTSESDAVRETRAFADAGIPFACVSLGADGSLAVAGGKSYRVHVPRIACKNPVGSGDSFVGGYATAIAQGKSPQEALRLAAACGTANAMIVMMRAPSDAAFSAAFRSSGVFPDRE